MPLTQRLNGSSSANLIKAAWFNDFMDLLTGVMKDQPVTIHHNITVEALGTTPAAPSATQSAGTGLAAGTYKYAYTYVAGDGGETAIGSSFTITTTSGNGIVNVSSIATGPTGTTARNLYRTKAGNNTFYLVHTINDNTTTTYADSTPDASLPTTTPPDITTFGGSIIFKDSSGNKIFTISNNGSIEGPVKIGYSTSGDAFSAGSSTTMVGNPSHVSIQIPAGVTEVANFQSGSLTLGNATTLNYDLIMYGDLYLKYTNTATPSKLIVGTAGLGVKMANGTKIFEVRGNGNAIISGTQYQTSAGSIGTVSGQSFDGYDVAEVYQCDQDYPSGTIVCLDAATGKMQQCTHDACPFATVVSNSPGFLMGAPDAANAIVAVALSGRVQCKTTNNLTPRTWVTSDGSGGVRAIASGETAVALGYTLESTNSGLVGIFLRSLTVTGV